MGLDCVDKTVQGACFILCTPCVMTALNPIVSSQENYIEIIPVVSFYIHQVVL